MTRTAFLTAAMLCLLGHGSARAQYADALSSGTLTLSSILDAADAANPEILAAKSRWEAVRSRIAQAATPDKPRLDIERMYAPSGKTILNGADEKSLSVTQEFPFPTTLYHRRRAAVRTAEMAEQEYHAKVRDVEARARSAFAMLFLAHRGIEIANENIDLMRRFAKVAESKFTAGHASQSDALKAEVELTKMLNMTIVLAQEKASAEAMLNSALGRDADAPLGTPREPDPSSLTLEFAALRAFALAGRPELKGARLGVKRADASLSAARSEYLPDLMLQYRRRTDPMRGVTQDGVLGLSLPLWFWRPAAMVGEAKAEKRMAEAELKAAEIMSLADLRTAFARAQAAKRLAESYRTSVFPQAETALKVAEAGYQTEKTSFLDLLDAQRSLLTFRLEYYQYLTEFEQRVAELERAVGRRLP